MSGKWITSKQVEIYMKSRKQGKTQQVSAAQAGISERSGRHIEKATWSHTKGKQRNWRTRKDPFEPVWSTELEPMLQAEPQLSALTLLEFIQDKHGALNYPDKLLRTLQRRVLNWRHTNGPDQEVIFNQQQIPGLMGLSDFTELKDISVTIQQKPFKHLLYHFRLAYSKWSYMEVICGGESFSALSQGLQHALWSLGGAPLEHRTDSLSAAFKNINPGTQHDLTQNYEELCAHYQMKPTRNNKGVSHENGAIESPHGHLKRRIKQAFLIRGHHDFDSIADYQAWLSEVVKSHNRRNAKQIELEKMALQGLPVYKVADYTVLPAKVSRSSTIQVRTSLYSVPSRLIGANLQVHLYHDRLECYLSGTKVAELTRVYGEGQLRRARNIDYRHMIESLIKKPMAFYHSQLRDAMLPNEDYRQIWLYLSQEFASREASKIMVGLLGIAAKYACELSLGQMVLTSIHQGEGVDLEKIRSVFCPEPKRDIPELNTEQHHLSAYNQLLKEAQHVIH
jgi:hypothetical protein